MARKENYLITGGAGFIGSNYTDHLLARGAKVTIFDNLSRRGADRNLAWLREKHGANSFDLVVGDVRQADPLLDVASKADVIVHLAAVTDLNGKTLDYYNANIQGTQNIVDISKKLTSLKTVLFTSSMYVCKPGYIPKSYDDYKPHTLYGESKVKGELIVKAVKDAAYKWVIIRPTSIWGPWFNIPYIDFFNIVYQGKYFDFGRTCTKSYGFVDNTVFQIKKLIDADVHGKTFYLGDEPAIQISEWANEISLEMGKGGIKKIPFFLMQSAAWGGDILTKLGIKFPITSFRLSNMTTNNILPLQDLYAITGSTPVSRLEGVKKTISWLVQHKGYKL